MRLIMILVKLYLLPIMIINCGIHFDGCSKLSKGCRFEEAYGDRPEYRYEIFVCDSLSENFEMSMSEKEMCKKTPTTQTEVYFKLSSPQIFDKSMNISSLGKFLREMNELNYHHGNNMIYIKMRYSNLKGFDLNTSFLIDDLGISPSNNPNKNNIIYHYNFEIFDSDFKFYLYNQQQDSCTDLFKWNLTEPKSLLQIISHQQSQIEINFIYNKYSEKTICPIFFNNAKLNNLAFYHQINTFYKSNYLKFSQIKNSDMRFLNTKVETLWAYGIEKIDIDSNSFLNKYLFHNLKELGLFGEIRSIEKDIFKSFKSLKTIYLDVIFFKQLTRKGTEWISSINFDLHVNLTNKSELDLNVNHTKMIYLNLLTIFNAKTDTINIFLDEDFCLFRNYPFDQLIIIKILYLKRIFSKKYTCTLQWVLKNIHFYVQYPQILGFDLNYIYSDFLTSNNESNKFENCDFDRMIDKCNRTMFNIIDNERTINDRKEVSIMIEYVLIVLLPVVCFLGIISNGMISYTLSIKDNKKDFKVLQYSYLKMVSISNLVLLILTMLSPIYECQRNRGAYCSRLYNTLFAQYYKIIFGEFLCTVFTMISNFGYVGYSLSRLSLVGKDHSKLIKFFSKLSIVYYIIVSTIISVALSVVKVFRYQVNELDPYQDYPMHFDRNYNNMFSPNFATKARLVNIFNAFADLTNYFVFILLFIILDIALVVKLRKTLSEKMQSNIATNSRQVVFRITLLVVSFAIYSILLKLPASLKSILDSIHLNNKVDLPFTSNHIDYLYEWYCIYARFCPTYEKFTSNLFMISISTNIFFYYWFDANFKFGLKIAYDKITSDKESHLEYIKWIEKIRSKK